MSTLITEFSDYALQSIEYFITQLETKLSIRDLAGLTNNKIQKMNISKRHPLAVLLGRQLEGSTELFPGVIPGISVTPGDMLEEGFTLGQGLSMNVIDDTFIDILNTWYALTDAEIQAEVLITKNQIDTIKTAYEALEEGERMLEIKQEWRRNEAINISLWSDSADLDILFGNLLDSIIAKIQVGFIGDDSRIKKFMYNVAKGLTNFNFGRILFGTEYNLTFMNTYINYTIVKEDLIEEHDFNGTFTIPGEMA